MPPPIPVARPPQQPPRDDNVDVDEGVGEAAESSGPLSATTVDVMRDDQDVLTAASSISAPRPRRAFGMAAVCDLRMQDDEEHLGGRLRGVPHTHLPHVLAACRS